MHLACAQFQLHTRKTGYHTIAVFIQIVRSHNLLLLLKQMTIAILVSHTAVILLLCNEFCPPPPPVLTPNIGGNELTALLSHYVHSHFTYRSMPKEFTVAAITVFAAVCSTIICRCTLIDRWGVTWAAISTASYTWGRPRGNIKSRSINVYENRPVKDKWTVGMSTCTVN